VAADYTIPKELRYTAEDEWVRGDADKVTIGVTDFAQLQLGDIVFVELPKVGDQIARGASFGVIESVKAVSDLYAPISGEVLEVNLDLDESPELVNVSCYDNGWMLILAPSVPAELDELLDAPAYEKSIAERDS
jgi:glycine cleavage system H protein